MSLTPENSMNLGLLTLMMMGQASKGEGANIEIGVAGLEPMNAVLASLTDPASPDASRPCWVEWGASGRDGKSVEDTSTLDVLAAAGVVAAVSHGSAGTQVVPARTARPSLETVVDTAARLLESSIQPM